MKLNFVSQLLVLSLLCIGCEPPQMHIRPQNPLAREAVQPDAVDIYVDCSGSMKGYVDFTRSTAEQANPNFKKIVPTFINNVLGTVCRNREDKLKVYRVTDNQFQAEPGLLDFYSHLTDGTIFGGHTTELNEMITEVIGRLKGQNRIAVIVTDGVLSFGPSKLYADRMYNIKNKNLLSSYIHNALVKEPMMTMALIKYVSDFNGNYYYDCREQVPYKGILLKDRPFYFFIIGEKQQVAAFLKNEQVFPPSQGIYAVSTPARLQIGLFKKKREAGKLNTLLKVDQQGNGRMAYEKEKDRIWIVGVRTSGITRACFDKSDDFYKHLYCDDRLVTIKNCTSDLIDPDATNPNQPGDYDYFYEIVLNKGGYDSSMGDKEITFYFDPGFDMKNSSINTDYDLESLGLLERRTWGLDLISEALLQVSSGKKPHGAEFSLLFTTPSKQVKKQTARKTSK